MARKIDENKLARIKKATMKTIVDCGIEKTTIAMIAKNANVSGGYLYRLYSGKQALIDELYFDKVAAINNELEILIKLNHTNVSAIISGFIKNRIDFAVNNPEASKFYYQLLHNNNFQVNKNLKEQNLKLIDNLKSIGLKTGEIGKNINILQIHFHLFIYVIDYINFKKINHFGIETINNKDVIYLTENILNILKKDN
ncbi:TetR/AcrR family transcriptional regulator [uncultured Lutibacter sp.]|uniref:TetR/AcrR family transcriptional regulator n=1 Tax=uncultured Lutibacter sp. TaxID=437739 RepID=UPI002616C4FC|nr:TetR/AcrR family transcriptional regulator [uncultured Lutibacter sp.]